MPVPSNVRLVGGPGNGRYVEYQPAVHLTLDVNPNPGPEVTTYTLRRLESGEYAYIWDGLTNYGLARPVVISDG